MRWRGPPGLPRRPPGRRDPLFPTHPKPPPEDTLDRIGAAPGGAAGLIFSMRGGGVTFIFDGTLDGTAGLALGEIGPTTDFLIDARVALTSAISFGRSAGSSLNKDANSDVSSSGNCG